jgi:transposase
MNYLGLDYHKKYSFATIITEHGEIKEKEKLLNKKESFKEYLDKYDGVVAVVEACWNWPVAIELLDGLVDEVKLANPVKVKAIAEARIKTDSIDSETLAYLLRADLIPEAYLRDKRNLQRQKILRMRSFFVKLRTQVKNRVHVLIDGQGEEIREIAKGYSDLFGKGGLRWLGELRLNEPDEKMLRGLLILYELLCKQVRATDGIVKEIANSDEDCALLKSIPGIGEFFAVLIKTEIGNIERFPSSSKLCSYAGIVPSTYASGGKVWHGKITKQGNRWLRWVLVEAVIPAISSNGELRSYYEKIRYRKGPKAAKVSTARRLTAIIYRVLKEKDSFKLHKTELKKKAELPSGSPSAA